MGSKTFLFFCISLAVVLMITSEVAARDLAETSTSVDNCKKSHTQKFYFSSFSLFSHVWIMYVDCRGKG